MPVDLRPLFIFFVAVVVPIAILAMRRWRIASLLIAIEVGALAWYLWSYYAPYRNLIERAESGDAIAQYSLSRWYANKSIFGQSSSDLDSSFYWLKISARSNYPPALYALGVIYKEGRFVPSDESDHILAGRRPDPMKGQTLIDKALKLGYRPTVREDIFYDTVYRVDGY